MSKKARKRQVSTNRTWFSNVEDVVEYLQGQGFKVSRSSVFAHRKEGKLVATAKGNFSRKAVHFYAANYLAQHSTGATPVVSDLQSKKLMAEVALKTEQARTAKLQRERQEGRLIPREDVELQLAGRAAVLIDGLKAALHARLGEIQEAAGQGSRNLVMTLEDVIDNAINEYAQPLTFEVEV